MDYLLVCASIAIALTIGANDIANAIGTTVGANVLKYRNATLLATGAVVVGALFQGSNNIATIGKGIIDTTFLDTTVLGLSLICAALAVAIATYLRYPVSATQSVVGALAGVGIAAGIDLNSDVLFDIVIIWVLLPFISAALSFSLYFFFRTVFRRIFSDNFIHYERVISFLVVASGIAVAYTLGANNIGNIVGILHANEVMRTSDSIVLGAFFIAVGALLFSRRVILTVGKGITTLDPLRAFVSQLSSAVAVMFCTLIGIPVSLSQATVGSVIGVGLTQGRSAVKRRFVASIVLSWILTPLISGTASFFVYRIIM